MNDTYAHYENVRRLIDGRLVGLRRFAHTVGLCVGIKDGYHECCYYYPNYSEAATALLHWDGKGDPSGRWVKAMPW